MTRGAALTGALRATVAAPATWPLALAAFLIRGGILLVALPILVLPTPVGLGNLIAPALTSIAFGSISNEIVVALVAMVVLGLGWILAGGWLAAALEAESTRIVATDDDVRALRPTASSDPMAAAAADALAHPRHPRRTATRIVVARLMALLPLAVALAWASVRIVVVTYRELTNPSDVATPIVGRVLLGSSDVVLVVLLCWVIGEVVGAIAARRIVLGDAGVAAALGFALAACVRHPFSTFVRYSLPTVSLLLVLVPWVVAAAAAWSATDAALEGPSDPLVVSASVIVFVGLWIVGLLLTAVVCAWRAAVWTTADILAEGTFGGSGDRRPGHWHSAPTSAKV